MPTLTIERRAFGVAQVTMSRRDEVFNALDEAREGFAASLAKRPAHWIPER